MRFLVFLIFALIMPALVSKDLSASQAKTIPLFLQEVLDVNGKLLPVDPGLNKFLAFFEKETGLRFQVFHYPWNRAKLMSAEGKGIIWGFSKSHERMQTYRYSETVMRSRIWAIAYGEPKKTLNRIEDLRGKTVSVERGVSHGIEFEEAKNTIFKVDEDTASAAKRFSKLVAKRSEALLWGLVQFDEQSKILAYLQNTYIPKLGDPSLEPKKFYVSSTPLFFDSIHFATGKGKLTAEMDLIDAAIKRGLKSGELAKILKELE